MVFGHMSEIAICMLFAKQTNKQTHSIRQYYSGGGFKTMALSQIAITFL